MLCKQKELQAHSITLMSTNNIAVCPISKELKTMKIFTNPLRIKLRDRIFLDIK